MTVARTHEKFIRESSFLEQSVKILSCQNFPATRYLMYNISYKCTYPDQLPTPANTATFSNSTTAVLTVSFDPQCCNTVQLNVDITTTSSSAATPVVLPVDFTDPTNTTIVITDITEGVSYTASIWSVCRDANSLLEDSGVLVVSFMTNGECVHPCVHMSVSCVCTCRCVHVCTCMCTCMCGGVHTAYVYTYVHIPTILC